MFILGERWHGGYLDYHRAPAELRIQVVAWRNLERLNDVFLQQPSYVQRAWQYVREIGLRAVIQKVRSRLGERLRDRRFVAIGLGEVIEGPADGLATGTAVVFVAPCHPELVERLVLPVELVQAVPAELLAPYRNAGGISLQIEPEGTRAVDWSPLAGWNRFSGASVNGQAGKLLDWAAARFARRDAAAAKVLPLPLRTEIYERTPIEPPSQTAGTLSAVLFGQGNYAKSVILPSLDRRIQVRCIHEAEPTQIGRIDRGGPVFDTAPTPRAGEHQRERYDVYCIASYHHTHAALAVAGLQAGAHVICEKPPVTTRRQLDELLTAMRENPGRYFLGFHMRYSPLWQHVWDDLGVQYGDAVHYHAMVSVPPLPARHWYHWPNSRSRIVRNCCHWLDHFLFMNAFSRPVRWDLRRLVNEDLHVSVELLNGAAMTLTLTSIGAWRLGVQDNIQLRSGDVTVHVESGSRYLAENSTRVLRRRAMNKHYMWKNMYATISKKILAGEPGDTVESTETTASLMLSLDEMHG